MRSLSASLGRRGFGYVAAVTLVITLVGAGGMYAFESNIPNKTGLNDYGSALWWTAMLMTTMGSEYWPQTPEGRVLCFLLSLYAFTVFGYLTAAMPQGSLLLRVRHFLYWTRCRKRHSRNSRGKVYSGAA